MTASVVIVIAQGLINVYEQLQKQNYTLRVNDVIKNILSGMKESDRWGNIEKSKTLARCTFLDLRFKDVPFSEVLQQTTKTEIIQLTTAIISSSGTGLSEKQSIPNDSTKPKNSFSIWSTVDTKETCWHKYIYGNNGSTAVFGRLTATKKCRSFEMVARK
jgi:hypothetical protein